MSELFTIKPLEWWWFESTTGRTRGYTAKACDFSYTVYEFNAGVGGGEPLWTNWRWGIPTRQMHDCPSPEEGKRLAEQHWRDYIEQALIPVDGSQAKEAEMDAEQNIDELDAEQIERIEIEDGRRCGECGSTEMGHCVYCKMD